MVYCFTFLIHNSLHQMRLAVLVLSGLGLRPGEFKNALKQVGFNVFVQGFNFGVVSATVYGISRGLVKSGAIIQGLGDGMVVCACLPISVNMVSVLTKSSGGDEAAAIFNSAFGNVLGVFLSPVLILGYLGARSDLNLMEVFYQLAARVIAPLIVGQIMHATSAQTRNVVKRYRDAFKKAQLYALVFIVYCVFCTTFQSKSDATAGDIFVIIAFQFFLKAGLMALAWISMQSLFPNQPKLIVMGLFGCTHKTVSRF